MGDESGGKQRLLIVDDSRVIRVTARKILQGHFETIEAIDGENAWELLNNAGPFSLVVTDLTMPNLDGFGLLDRIRNCNLPQIKDLPVIVITGANDSETIKERATQAGATDFIGKPFDSVHLLARTQAHASARATTQTLTEENIELEDQSQTDPLTGLANEAAFMDRSFQQLSYAVRHRSSLAVFRVEIDDFGNLFKKHGKNITDTIIKSVSMVLESCIRQEDMAARVGVAKFSLLLPGMNTNGIRNLADRINRDISARILKQGENRIRYTVSIGVAAPGIQRDTRFDELLAIADSRLKCATSNGGNQVVFDETGVITQRPDTAVPEPISPPILTDDAINKMINPPGETDSAFTASINAATDKSAQEADVVPAIESRSVTDSQELPGMFAGPVPDLSMPDTVTDSSSKPRTTATLNPAALTFDHESSDAETIVITAPFDVLDPVDEAAQPEPDKTNTTTHPEQITADVLSSALSNHGAENDTPRPGFIKRLFSPLARLFRRSA